jgi:ABC-type antimicrobial peptide transport system permease subunit
MALGAQRRQIAGLVLRHALILAVFGAVVGVAIAFALTRLLSTLLYGVDPMDPLTFAAVSAAVTVTALIATYVPARRAASLDPITA